MTAAIEAHGLGKQYGRRWALADCTLSIPAGHVVGLVGPNGAGKTTLVNLVTGMLTPTTGSITVLGKKPASDPGQLASVGYVAQDTPTYSGISVEDHLRFGAHMNPAWDNALARKRVQQLGLDPKQKAGKLSGGQRAQLALTLAIAKRPQLLMLDEPIASLDPLARREFLQILMEATADQEFSVVMSSHLVTDLERVARSAKLIRGAQQRADPGSDVLRRPSQSRGPGPRVYGKRKGRLGPPDAGGHPMIWLSWRQFRVQAIVAGAALVVVAVALTVTGPHLAALFDSNGLATCRTTCSMDAANFGNQMKGSTTELIFYGSVFLMYAVTDRRLLGRAAGHSRA